jgi:hypothetical protein
VQAILETMRAKEPMLACLEDKTQQIGVESGAEDVAALKNEVQAMRDAFSALKNDVEAAAEACRHLLAERREFLRDLATNSEQLRHRLGEVKVNELMGMDEAAVASRLARFLKVKESLTNQLGLAKVKVDEQRAKFAVSGETMSLDLQDALAEFDKLRGTIEVSVTIKNYVA